MTKATTVVVTFSQFARGIGASDRITLEASLDWHKQYVTLDASSKSAWKRDWLVNYVVGRLDCTTKQAEAICDKTRVQRTASEEKAVNTGSKRFSDHISRTTVRSGKKPSNPVVVPKQLLNSIKSEIIDAGLTKAQFDALIAQLRDSVAFQ
jgi:thiamine pyrophosphokinase